MESHIDKYDTKYEYQQPTVKKVVGWSLFVQTTSLPAGPGTSMSSEPRIDMPWRVLNDSGNKFN